MYVCICKSITDSQIRKAVCDKGIHNLRGLRRELGACDQCGKCAPEARQIIHNCHVDRRLMQVALPSAA